MSAARRRPPAALSHALALLGYLALTLAMLWPLPAQFATAIPGDSFDGWQNYWNLWWVRTALLERGASPYFTDMLYYPTGVSLAFQTMNLFNGMWSLPIGLVWGLLPAYNAVVLFSFVIAAFGAYLLARYALRRAGFRAGWIVWPALLAGLVYAFAPFHMAHLLGHMQVFSLEWLPFAGLALLRGMDVAGRRAAKPSALLGAAATAALMLILAGLCDWYFALYLALFTALIVIYRLLERRLGWRRLAVVGLAWLGFLLVLAPLWVPMAQEAARASYMVPDASQVITLSADLLAFITPNELHPLWGPAASAFASRFASTPSERIVFAGFVPLALGLIAAIRLGRHSRLWWLAGLIFAVLALGPVLHVSGQTRFGAAGVQAPMPYALLYWALPVVRIARSVSRFDAMVMLSLSILAALGLAALLGAQPRRPQLAGLAAGALVCFEFLSAPYPFSPPDTPAYYAQLAAEPGRFAVLNLPANWDRPGYLLYQTVHGKPLTAGYISRDDPRTLVYRAPVLQELRYLEPDILCQDVGRLGPSVLDWLGIRYVILDRYKMPAGAEREVTTALAGAIFAGQTPTYEDERLTVYRLQPPARRLPFAVLGDGWGPRQKEGGAVWRSVGRQATLEVEAPDAGDRRIRLHAAGPAGTVLRLSAGSQTAEATLQPEGIAFSLEWTANGASTPITLTVAGPGPARVSAVSIE